MGSQKPLSYSTPNMRRSARNLAEAEALRKLGYEVYTSDEYPNDAFYAIEKGSKHYEHEKIVCEIAAENGLNMTLEKDGTVKVRLKNGTTLRAKSLDGTIEKFTQEIAALKGIPDVSKVSEAIEHSLKKNAVSEKQADVAITITPAGSKYKTSDILAGVEEYKRKLRTGETKAKPMVHIHMDAQTRKIYVNKLK